MSDKNNETLLSVMDIATNVAEANGLRLRIEDDITQKFLIDVLSSVNAYRNSLSPELREVFDKQWDSDR